MSIRFAFAGFRHPHILALYKAVQEDERCTVAATCEEDAESRNALREIDFTHESISEMLETSDAQVVAIGDVYARRGAIAIAALEAGKHVISDKPICASLEELDKISSLVREKNLSVGCQLDLTEVGSILKLREIIRSGEIGEVVTINIGAQHPLRLVGRASWYFEPGNHGGTINDIGIHAFDLSEWLTGKEWDSVLNAREWNAKATSYPHFGDSAQVLGVLKGGAGVFADLSYLAPDKQGYALPHYWRVTVHGTRGMAETHYTSDSVQICTDNDDQLRSVNALPGEPNRYFHDFLAELEGKSRPGALTTTRVLKVARLALEAQARANGQ